MLKRTCSLLAIVVGITAFAVPGHPANAPAARELTDARVLGILGAGDVNQIEACKLAMTKASSADVRAYAKMMVKNHEASFKENTDLSKRLKLVRLLPEDSTMARAHKVVMTELNLLKGEAFDSVFLAGMVKSHTDLIQEIKTTLLPGTQRRGVKEFIRRLLPVLTSHQIMGQTLLAKGK